MLVAALEEDGFLLGWRGALVLVPSLQASLVQV